MLKGAYRILSLTIFIQFYQSPQAVSGTTHSMDRGRIDQHVSRVLNTIQTAEERVQKSYTVAHMYSKVGEYDKALQYIDTYLTSYHSDAPAFYLRGFILEKKGRIQDAISAYSESLKLKPKQKELIAKVIFLNLYGRS